MDSSEQQTQASGNRMELFLEACKKYYSLANECCESHNMREKGDELSNMRAAILNYYSEFKGNSLFQAIEKRSSEELIGKLLAVRDARLDKSADSVETPGETTTNDEPEL